VADNPLFDKYGQTLRDGTVIFKEGDVGDKMYIIQDGVVRIEKTIDGRKHKLAELGKSEFFGEMAIVSNTPRSVIDKLSKRLQNANNQIQTLVRSNRRSMIALNLYNRFAERSDGEQALTLDAAVEGIALELESPRDTVAEVIMEFDRVGICKIEGNAIRLRDKKALVALVHAER